MRGILVLCIAAALSSGCKRVATPEQVCTKVYELQVAEDGTPSVKYNGHPPPRDEWVRSCAGAATYTLNHRPKRWACMAECTMKAKTLAEATCGNSCPANE